MENIVRAQYIYDIIVVILRKHLNKFDSTPIGF